MPSPDRLDELRRQRALIGEHLAWLDREIERAAAANTPKPENPAIPASETPSQSAPLTRVVTSSSAADSESILDQYRVSNSDLHSDVRKGCLIYFAAALLLLGAAVAGLYFALRH